VKTGASYCPSEVQPKNAFRAVLVCEDDAGAKTGMEVCQLLLSCFENRLQFHIQIWPFGLFQSGNLNQAAVRDAINADAIIVATYHRDDLPPAIKEWIRAWVPQKTAQAAILIGLFQSETGLSISPVAAFNLLKNAANEAGIDFLVRHNHPPASVSRPRGLAIHPAPDGWGIND